VVFDETSPDIARVPFRDVRTGWFTDYVNYAFENGLLNDITNTKELKGNTPIMSNQLETMLNNAGIDTSLYRIFKKNNKVKREDMAALMVKAFEGKFAYAEYMMGENIKFYQMVLEKLQGKSASEQEIFVRNLIEKVKTWDKKTIESGMHIYVPGVLKFFDAVLGMK
jgi:hypothetical protein